MACDKRPLPEWVSDEVNRILHMGNTAEIKRERGEYVVIEIKRKAIKNIGRGSSSNT